MVSTEHVPEEISKVSEMHFLGPDDLALGSREEYLVAVEIPLFQIRDIETQQFRCRGYDALEIPDDYSITHLFGRRYDVGHLALRYLGIDGDGFIPWRVIGYGDVGFCDPGTR